MLTLSCPSCGANVDFRSKASVFAVCSFCKSTLVRHDMNLENIGKMSEIQDDLTPLQLGTTGNYDGKKFEIIGRLRIAYEDGFWNEWYALFGGDKTGWLAEAQGFYAMCFSVSAIGVPSREKMVPGAKLSLDQEENFEIEDVRNVVCKYSEGELPVNAVNGRQSLSVDLTAPGSKMGTIEYAEREIRMFFGYYQEFDDFGFANLRHIDGW
jgi:hypothetical protein